MRKVPFAQAFQKPLRELISGRKLAKQAFWLVIYGAIFFGVQSWQNRNLLAGGQIAPGFQAKTLDGKEVSLDDYSGRPVVLYFFAPWCKICAATSSNVSDFYRENREKVQVLGVALSYRLPSEVEAFANNHELDFPVLLGSEQVAQQYRVDKFPTFYFIDEQGRISTNTSGYTTGAGFQWRIE